MSKKKQTGKKFRELPPVDTKLTGKFKGSTYKAKIVRDDDFPTKRAVEYKGENYSSLTAAAMAITKSPVNGWRFWKF